VNANNLKVLLLSDNFLPHLGGVERHVYTLLRFLQSNKVDTTILTSTKEKDTVDSEFNINRDLDFLPRNRAIQWPYVFKRNSEILRDTINSLKDEYDVVHYHGTYNLFTNEIKSNVNLISTLHGILPACISFWGITEWCDKRPSPIRCSICVAKIRQNYIPLIPGMIFYSSYFYRNIEKSLKRYNLILAVSDFVKNIVKNAYSLNNINTVYNFIDIKNDMYKKLPCNCNHENHEDKMILLYSGRLDEQKGISILLESYLKIKEDYKDTELIITGSGELEDKVKKHSDKYESIQYLGYLDRKKQLEVLNKSSIFLAPSIYPDACPTNILEAMSLGKPVVSTSVGGIPELVLDGQTGHIVKPHSSTEFVNGVKKVLHNGPDTYSDACVRQAKKFDINTIGYNIIKTYSELSLE
jgi:glycosyltransferase involved in cell wall biosynthesis